MRNHEKSIKILAKSLSNLGWVNGEQWHNAHKLPSTQSKSGGIPQISSDISLLGCAFRIFQAKAFSDLMTRCDTNCVPQVSEIHPFKRMLDEFGCFKQKLRAMLHGTRLKWSKSSHITYRLTLVIPLVTSVHTKRWSSTGCVSKSASRSIPPNCKL